MLWRKYVSEAGNCWWWCEANGDWFLENRPGSWTQYWDPVSEMRYWWRDDDSWFWINGCRGEPGRILTANAAVDDQLLDTPVPESPVERTAEPQPEHPLETADLLRWSTPRAQAEPPPARQASSPPLPQPLTCNGVPPPPAVPPPQPSTNRSQHTLLGDIAPAGVAWQYPFRDEGRNSYVGHLPACLPAADARAYFRIVMDSMSVLGWERPPLVRRSGSCGGGGARRSGVILRGTKWLVCKGCHCTYPLEGMTLKPTPFPDWMDQLMQRCMPACGLADRASWPNSCTLNGYSDGSEAFDWHSDDERLFGGLSETGERIISLALGSERLYEMRPSDISTYEDAPPSCSLRLKGGDIWTMEGQTPRHYMNRVPKYPAGKQGPVRFHVSVIWRWIVAHESRSCCR